MNVLFLDAYYEPEQIAFTHLEKDLIEGLISCGHTVNIVCPVPTRGIDQQTAKKYSKIKHQSRYKGKVKVTRFWAPQEGKNPLIRAFRYFWCNLRTYQIALRVKNVDVVFANSTPPTQGWIAGMVAKKLNVPFIYSLQDIFPDSLVTTGLTKKGSLLWKIGRILEDATYKGCSRIIVISEAMKENLLQKKVKKDKIQVISNWIDLDMIKPVFKESNKLFDEFGISRDKFIVLYAGNFGAAQGAEIVLDAAEMLEYDKTIQFVIFGGGAGYADAEERAKSLSNVFIHPLLPQNRVSEVYSMGDVALITCKKGVGKSGMPSKTWSIMACDTPIIACFDNESEMEKILDLSRGGVCIGPENSDELIKSILSFYSEKNKKIYNTREYLVKHFSKQICVSQYLEEMRKTIENTND